MTAAHLETMLREGLDTGGITAEAMIGASPHGPFMAKMFIMHGDLRRAVRFCEVNRPHAGAFRKRRYLKVTWQRDRAPTF